jgi:hypothetical protein
MIFDAIGILALGELPPQKHYAPAARYIGVIGKTRRLEDMELQILGITDPDFDLDRAIALWLMWNEQD